MALNSLVLLINRHAMGNASRLSALDRKWENRKWENLLCYAHHMLLVQIPRRDPIVPSRAVQELPFAQREHAIH